MNQRVLEQIFKILDSNLFPAYEIKGYYGFAYLKYTFGDNVSKYKSINASVDSDEVTVVNITKEEYDKK